MMKILVIDNYLPRHQSIVKDIDTVFDDKNVHIVEHIDIGTIQEINPDIILLHRNNPEKHEIMGSSSLSTYLIIYSGGTSGYFADDIYEQHVRVDLIIEALAKIREQVNS